MAGRDPRRHRELVIPEEGGLSFAALQLRLHPAESRIRTLSAATPAVFVAFDLIADARRVLLAQPLAQRRAALEAIMPRFPADRVRLSQASRSRADAERWLDGSIPGLDGVMAKRLDAGYRSGERTAMVKVKRIRTADCVVGGFRYGTGTAEVGSLLLGLYDEAGLLHHIGFAANIPRAERRALTARLERLIAPPGFSGRAPGGPSRWSTARSAEWQPLRPKLVVEVAFDHVGEGRMRHGAKLLRWRSDKRPDQCGLDQLG